MRSRLIRDLEKDGKVKQRRDPENYVEDQRAEKFREYYLPVAYWDSFEPLTTVPVRDWQVVLAKFFGALIFYVILWIPTLLYFAIFLKVTNEPAAHSAGAYAGSYLMLLLLGMFYLSIGCLTSVLTRNQIIAAVISFCAI